MSDRNLLYSLPSDNVAALVTPTVVTGTINSAFPLTRLYDLDPATHVKTTGTGDFRLQWDFTTAQRIDAIWIPMYNMPAGNIPRFEGSASASWGSPTLSASRTVPAYLGGLPRGLFIDLRHVTGYSTSGFRYWSLIIPNPSQITAIGEAFLSKSLRNTRNYAQGLSTTRSRVAYFHPREDDGMFVNDRHTDRFNLAGSVVVDTRDSAINDLWSDCLGGVLPFPIVLHPEDSVPEGHYVRWMGEWTHQNNEGTIGSVSLPLSMVGRGRLP